MRADTKALAHLQLGVMSRTVQKPLLSEIQQDQQRDDSIHIDKKMQDALYLIKSMITYIEFKYPT